MIELRDYQVELVERLRVSYRSGKRAPIMVCSTGSGKTVMFAHITAAAAAIGHRTLILAHRRELVKQASDKLTKFDVQHTICMSGYGACSRDTVVVGSVQTVARRLPQLGLFQLIVADESHHATAAQWRAVLAAQPQARLLGCTATPCRLDGTGLGAHCGGLFDDLVEGPSMAALIVQGYLAPLIGYAPKLRGLENARLRKRAGEFAAEDDAALMDRPTITGDAIGHYRRYADGKQAIAFCCTVPHTQHVAEGFTGAGIPSESIDGSMKTDQRDAILKRFASGETRVLTSCELLSEGFDAPEASVAIMLRHTASLTVFRQQVGRIMRPAPGKTAILLDHVKNSALHGMPDEPVEWSLEGKPKRPQDSDGNLSLWTCPKCYRICTSQELKCPDCGTERPHEKRELPRQVDGELTLIQRPWEQLNISYEQYVAVVLNRERKRMEQDRIWASKYAAQRGYKSGWVEHVVASKHKTRLDAALSGQSKSFDYLKTRKVG